MTCTKKNRKKRFKYIDIFAGCGGIDLGFYNAGWEGLFAIEKNPMAFETLKHNLIDNRSHFRWPRWLPVRNYCINTVLKKYKTELEKLRGKVDLVAGGPPCQGFSMALGKRNKNDFRNKLVNSYIRFVATVRPKVLFFENVRGFTIGFKDGLERGTPYSDRVLRRLKKLGYEDVQGRMIEFSEFGVPQRRTRFIIIGTLKGNANDYFENIYKKRNAFLKKKGLSKRISVKQAISDLEQINGDFSSPDTKHFLAGYYGVSRTKFQKFLRNGDRREYPDSHRFSNHSKGTVKVFKHLLKNAERNKQISESVRAKCGVKKRSLVILSDVMVSPTLTTHPDDYVHYREPRILTAREYARIQTFDDAFEFKGKYTTGGKVRIREVPRYTQLGNAVPPLFAEQSALVLKNMF